MPRWASRLTLTVTDVRVQRLQDISEADALAEGIQSMDRYSMPVNDPSFAVSEHDPNGWFPTATEAYEALWDKLNAGRGFGWALNPWIVAVSFTIEHRNIDTRG